jgi:hypothetical protein
MAGFSNVQALGDALSAGRSTYATWRKSPSQASTAGVWFDLSMSPGNPAPQYYAASPLVAKTLTQSGDGGLFHGGAVSPASKHLSRVTALTETSTALPLPMILCDYLLFYPFVDEGSTDEQPMDNTTTLPRYTDGAGVQVMAVSVAGRTGGQTFRFTYTNSAGVAGCVSQTVIQNTAAANGNIVTSQQANNGARGPFIPLQAGDTGVRSIQSVQMISGPDVGLFSLVLVKPLAQAMIRGIDAPVEVNYFTDFGQLPQIVDDAYLNFIVCPQGTLAATAIHGDITTVWSA